jgi:predicted acylesterase/phospholipase RssA
MFLSAVQDKYPDFAEHVFAISAVSGGSLGAAIFSALVNQEAEHKEDHWYWNHAQQFLKHDFLSELLSATLFLDLPARFFPCVGWFCPGDRLSRARALERSIESASLSIFPLGQNPFMGNVRELWDARKRAPALLLNTTEVETGERIVIAPWSLEDGVTPGLFSLSDRADDLQVRLSTAVGLSARFPWIMPAGWFTAKTGAKRRLVDGGYSDNSGVVTALDLITRLKGRTGVQLIIIALVSEADDVADFHN